MPGFLRNSWYYFHQPVYFMKRIFLIALIFSSLSIGIAYTQTGRGAALAGGGLSLFVPTGGGSDNFRFDFQPRLGFFVANNVAVGGILPITINRTGNTRVSSVGIKPFGRFYVGGSQLKLFLEGRFGLQHFTTKDIPSDRRTDQFDELSVGFGAGLAAFFNKHVALEPQISYDAYSRKAASYSGVTFNVALQIYFP